MLRTWLTTAGILIGGGVAAACVWDTHTLRDELQTNAEDFDLIAGQFPHHGSAYYEAQATQARARLASDAGDIIARNDLAVALLKLGRYGDAEREFTDIERRLPGRYETLSNLGVLRKKEGRFGEAATYTARALAIKPEGHLGLGDYYLKMLRWQAARADASAVPDTSYLGYRYDGGDHALLRALDGDEGGSASAYERREAASARIRAMIRSDRSFADAVLVLGDVLWQQSHRSHNLAFWAYVRARQLGHPNAVLVERRIGRVFEHWRKTPKKGKRVEARDEAVARATAHLERAQAWVAQFEAVEAELVARKGWQAVDFAMVEAELESRGIRRHRPDDVGLVRSTFAVLHQSPGAIVIWLLVLLVVLVAIRAVRKARATPGRARLFGA